MILRFLRALHLSSLGAASAQELRRIYDRIDSLKLTCQAMWELIRERTTLTDEDSERRMQEVDLRRRQAGRPDELTPLRVLRLRPESLPPIFPLRVLRSGVRTESSV